MRNTPHGGYIGKPATLEEKTKPSKYTLIPASLRGRFFRKVAQSGSASGLGPEGHRFESCRRDQILNGRERVNSTTVFEIVGNSMNDRKVDLWRLVAEQRRNESLLERLNEMHRKLEKAQWHLNQAQDLVNDLRYDG